MAELHAFAKLAGLDELEYVRSAVAGLSCKPDLSAKEVHVGRLSRLLGYAGLQDCRDKTLDTLEQLKEIQRIDGGYILPTPIRCVELTSDRQLLVAVHPTDELNRHFSSVTRAGSARLINSSESDSLVRQPLLGWMGADGQSAASWTQYQVVSGKTNLAPSLYDDTIQSFALKKGHGPASGFSPTWGQLTVKNSLNWMGMQLCRMPIAAKHYRYFFGFMDSKKNFLEGPTVYDHLRLRFGLAALANKPLPIYVNLKSKNTVFRLPSPPPPAERRLLIALCKQEDQASSCVWSCPSIELWPVVKDCLRNLECEFIEYE